MTEEQKLPEENQDSPPVEPAPEPVEGVQPIDPREESLPQAAPEFDETIESVPVVEESPVEETPIEAESAPAKQSMPKWLRKTLIWGLILGLVFCAGLILSQIVAVAPMRQSLSTLTQENMNLVNQVSDLESNLEKTQSELASAQTNITDLQTELTDTKAALQDSEAHRFSENNFLLLKNNISAARLAAANKDELSLRQNLIIAEKNLSDLEPYFDAEIYAILAERLENAQTLAETSLIKAAEELRLLSENLELMHQ